jgi:carbamoyltransferase
MDHSKKTKLLSLRLCEHDSNFSYFDGSNVHYFKSERKYGIKKHAYNDLYSWKKEIKEVWDLEVDEIKEIAIVFDPWNYNLSCNNEQFFPAIKYDLFPSSVPVWRVNHHFSHALSSWMIDRDVDNHIVIDGFGDLNNSWTVFSKNKIKKRGALNLTGSLGIAMANSGKFLGIEASHDLDIAGKLMGLQSYGKFNKEFAEIIDKYSLYDVDSLFNFDNWIDFKKDLLLAKLTPLDWINTVHYVSGQKIIDFFSSFFSYEEKITYSGGVAQNVLWNTELIKKFPNIIIPPHCGDEGLSLGSLEWLRIKNNLDEFDMPKFPFCQSDQDVEEVKEETIEIAAKLLSEGKIVGWYQGNGEIGPRALGNRSILMDPRIKNGKEKINIIKNRENYRPFGASILEKEKDIFFEDLVKNPYMLFVGKTKKEDFSSIVHVDGTCRAQTVNKENGSFFYLLKSFYDISGCPILLNTSLNLAGKPIASSVEEAYELFNNSKIDVLIVGNKIQKKENRI